MSNICCFFFIIHDRKWKVFGFFGMLFGQMKSFENVTLDREEHLSVFWHLIDETIIPKIVKWSAAWKHEKSI